MNTTARAFTDTQAIRNRKAMQAAAEREGRLMGLFVVECVIVVAVVLFQLFA